MAEVKWIKLSVGLPDSKKLRQIRTLPNGDTIALMWVFLMCLAGDTNDKGMVYFTPEIPYTDEMLAEEFRMDVNTVRLALRTFEQFDMIEIVDDIICLAAWEKWQSEDQLSVIREQTRNRVAKHRAKQRLAACNVTGNVTVTQCNATDIDKEEDKEGEEDIRSIVSPSEPPTTTKRFKPPTREEVQTYCQERGNKVDVDRFIDYYTSNGWKVGRNTMKDWKAAVRTWERSETPKGRKQDTGFETGNPFLEMLNEERRR